MSCANTDHSAVFYDTTGAVTCWADLRGNVRMPPVPPEILAKHPPRHRSPMGQTHPGTVQTCHWCNGLSDGDRGVFLAPSSPAAVEPEHRRVHGPAAGIAAHVKARDAGAIKAGQMVVYDPHAGGIRPAVPVPFWQRVEQITEAQTPAWSVPFLEALTWAVGVFSLLLFAIVGAVQVLRWCHVIH